MPDRGAARDQVLPEVALRPGARVVEDAGAALDGRGGRHVGGALAVLDEPVDWRRPPGTGAARRRWGRRGPSAARGTASTTPCARNPSAASSAIIPWVSSNSVDDSANVLKPVCQPSSNQRALDGMWRWRYSRGDVEHVVDARPVPPVDGRQRPARQRPGQARQAVEAGDDGERIGVDEEPDVERAALEGHPHLARDRVDATSNAPASREATNRPQPADDTRNGTGTCASLVPGLGRAAEGEEHGRDAPARRDVGELLAQAREEALIGGEGQREQRGVGGLRRDDEVHRLGRVRVLGRGQRDRVGSMGDGREAGLDLVGSCQPSGLSGSSVRDSSGTPGGDATRVAPPGRPRSRPTVS